MLSCLVTFLIKHLLQWRHLLTSYISYSIFLGPQDILLIVFQIDITRSSLALLLTFLTMLHLMYDVLFRSFNDHMYFDISVSFSLSCNFHC